MVTLYLLRHAKSDWDSGVSGDHERPLTSRGERAAGSIGGHLHTLGVEPDLVICSSARRAQQTWAIVSDALARAPEVRIDPRVYLASAATLLELVRSIPPRATSALLVGHNPGFHDLAVDLCGSGNDEDRARLLTKYPTAAVAAIRFDGQWSDVRPGTGHLERFVRPRDLRR